MSTSLPRSPSSVPASANNQTLKPLVSAFRISPISPTLYASILNLDNPLFSLCFYVSSSFSPSGSGRVRRNRCHKEGNRDGNMQPDCGQWKLEIAHNHFAEQNHFLRAKATEQLAIQS